MITAMELLKEYGTNNTILPAEIPNYKQGLEFVLDMRDNGGTSPKAVDIDLDVDGIYSGLVNCESLSEIGVKNVKPYLPKTKRHGIDMDTVDYYIRNGYSHVVLPDSSSNNMDELKKLSDAGIKVLIIDHHHCDYVLGDYPKNVVIINNKLEDVNCKEVSAGMLSYLFYQNVYLHLGMNPRTDHFIWGYVTLIADSCKLHDYFIAPIIKGISNFNNCVPYIMQLFMTEYDDLNRNFVTYKFANRINTLARTNSVELIEKFIFNRQYNLTSQMEIYARDIILLHQNVSVDVENFVNQIQDYVEDLGCFGFIDISKYISLTNLSPQFLTNSTGYLAAKLGRTYGKPVILISPESHSTYKGSIRVNNHNIDLIEVLKRTGLNGGGHQGAIGFTLPKFRLNEFKMYMSLIKCDDASMLSNDCLVIDGENMGFREFGKLMRLCAIHNETAGNGVPEVYISKKLNYSFKRKDYAKIIFFKMGDITVKSFNMNIDTDTTQLIKPIFDNGVVGVIQ